MKLKFIFCTVFILANLILGGEVFAQDPNFHIYLSFGQSNMAGAGDIEAQDRTVNSRFQFMKPQDCASTGQYAGNWYQAVPPLWGCNGGIGPSDYFGRTMVENLPSNITVGSVVVAVPGCKIELFGKTGYEGLDTYNNVPAQYNGSAYAWLLDLAKKAQQDGVIKGILLHQGESNTGDQQWSNKVKAIYDNLINDLGLDPTETPLLAGELLYQDQGGVCWGHNSVIARLPSVLPNSYVISAQGLPGKDIYHFNSAGNREFGVRYAQKMLSILPPVSDPSVTFESPINGASFEEGSDIALLVSASDPNGTITNVSFYNGNNLLVTDATEPYSFNIDGLTKGTYQLKAVATDNEGNTAEDIISIKVNVPQAPYDGLIHQIPGTIQVEDFDLGGNGFAYFDDSPGSETGVDFRTDEDVDIEACTDAGAGYNLGWATAGEWLEYSVNIEKAGTYDLSIRAACNGDGRTVALSMDATELVAGVAIPNTGGWQTWQTVKVSDINLLPGEKTLRLTIGETDFVNLNYLTFTLTKELKQEPYNGVAHQLPGRIEIEDYDLGGEGLAYHEANTGGNQGGAIYRDDEVDIEETGDLDGDYNIGYILNGEWLEYTVDVVFTGVYNLQLRVAADGDGRLMHVEVDGVDVTGPIEIPNTGGWQTWETITVDGINMTEGEHVIRLAFDSDYFNLNYMEFYDVITGLPDNAELAIMPYPNPFINVTSIEVDGPVQYKIFSSNGENMSSGTCSGKCRLGENLQPGIYFLTIEQGGVVQTFKVFKN